MTIVKQAYELAPVHHVFERGAHVSRKHGDKHDTINWYYSEQASIMDILTTQEAANAAVFLLSKRSSGINAQGVVIDAGMSTNYFDQNLMKAH